MKYKIKKWNRCDWCGRFISYKDIQKYNLRNMIEPDNAFGPEKWETTCEHCICLKAKYEKKY